MPSWLQKIYESKALGQHHYIPLDLFTLLSVFQKQDRVHKRPFDKTQAFPTYLSLSLCLSVSLSPLSLLCLSSCACNFSARLNNISFHHLPLFPNVWEETRIKTIQSPIQGQKTWPANRALSLDSRPTMLSCDCSSISKPCRVRLRSLTSVLVVWMVSVLAATSLDNVVD